MTDAAGGARGSARRQDVRTVLRRAATAASWAPAPTRPGFGSRLCPRVQRSPPGAPGRRSREGPGLCAQVLRVPQCACVRAEPCVCSDTEPTPDLPLRTLPPPRQHRGWKQGWGAGLSPQPPGPAAPSQGLLSLAACVQGFGASLELPRGWVGGLRVPQATLGWQTRLGSRWGHPGLTPGRRVPLGHRTSVTVWTAVLWLLGRRHLLQQKRDTEVAGGQSGTSGGCPA